MDFFTKKGTIQKILLVLIVLILFNFIAPQYVYCFDDSSVGGKLLKEVLQLLNSLGDGVMGLLSYSMLGAEFTSAMLEQTDMNINNADSWLYAGNAGTDASIVQCDLGEQTDKDITGIDDKGIFGNKAYQIPNMLYAPESIFANDIAALDVNFLRNNTFTAVSDEQSAIDHTQSTAGYFRNTIATWYKSFRNIAIVGLLSVLVYLGIRILIGSTAADKAKYKESLQNWLVALCLVFVIHFIMSGILMATDKFTELFASSVDGNIIVSVPSNVTGGNIETKGQEIQFRTNLTGLVRFKTQAYKWQEATGYTILYLIMVGYTVMFTFMYFKRFLYLAFFTMISPLVALTYPIDKAGDGQAQAFNFWFKEYVGNVIIQPVHLLLYTALVSSAMDLVKNNIIYALVAILFLIPAEKIIKQMFGLDKATTAAGFGDMAVASYFGNKLANIGNKSSSSKENKGENGKGDSEGEKDNIRTVDNRPTYGSFGDNSSNNENTENTNSEGRTPPKAQNEEHQRMLDDRAEWNQMANDEKETDKDREDVRREADLIDEDMRARGYLNDNDQNGNASPDSTHETIPNIDRGGTNAMPQKRDGWKKDLAIKGARKMGKVAYKGAKIATKVGGVVGGAAVGTGYGLAKAALTGDAAQIFKGAAVGAGVGGYLGNKAAELPEKAVNGGIRAANSVSDTVQGGKNAINSAKYGDAYATQQANIAANKKARKAFEKNKDNQEKYRQMAARIQNETGNVYEAKDLMRAAFDYQQAGIQDDKHIESGLKLEAKNGGVNGRNHQKMIDVMDVAKDLSKKDMIDDKSYAVIDRTAEANTSNKKDKEQILDWTAEALGASKEHNLRKNQMARNQGRGTTPTGNS